MANGPGLQPHMKGQPKIGAGKENNNGGRIGTVQVRNTKGDYR